jgi:hypothetical protein
MIFLGDGSVKTQKVRWNRRFPANKKYPHSIEYRNHRNVGKQNT